MIVVARGGGSVEDLLPFSDEGLIRAVHEVLAPRSSRRSATSPTSPCSTWSPTSAPRRPPTPPSSSSPTWPRSCASSRSPATGSGAPSRLARRASRPLLDALRSRPALADPGSLLDARADEVEPLRDRARRTPRHRLDRAADEIAHQRARARALSPLATLRRGYAVLQDADGHVRHLGRRTSPQGAAVSRAGRRRPRARHDHRHGAAQRGARCLSDQKIPYEQAREELIEVVRRLEAGGTTLEESLALWERGEQLATLCQDWLDGARERLDAAREE